MAFWIANFAVKNAMFSLNENNRIVMAQHPSDNHPNKAGFVRMVTVFLPLRHRAGRVAGAVDGDGLRRS